MNAFKAHLLSLPSYPYQTVSANIKLDQNESPYEPPAPIKERILARLAALPFNRYPELAAGEVRQVLAGSLGVEPANLVLSPGSNLLIQALVQAANRVVDTAPSFPHYALSAKTHAVPYTSVPLQSNFALDLEGMKQTMQGGAVVFLSVPHAPTAHLFSESDIKDLATAAEQTQSLLVIDEAYYQFSGTDYLALVSPNVAILRTFSKAWGLGGIRAGYLVAQPTVCQMIQNIMPPFGLPAHTTQILLEVISHPEYVSENATKITTERERLREALQSHTSWKTYPSATNFLLIRTPSAAQAYDQLLQKGILVRRQDSYPGLEGCIRVAVGTPAENDMFLEAAFALEAQHA
jgi:histidinol-phosphate aminotransferase